MEPHVISAAMRMSVDQLAPLLNSLAENVPNARVILLVNDADTTKRQRIRELNPKAELHPVSAPAAKSIFWLPPKSFRKAVVKPILGSLYRGGWMKRDELAFAAMEPHISRYYYIRELLEELMGIADGTNHVLLTDSRDVVVQSDPFENLGEGVYCGLEDVKIGERTLNHEWIAHLYGEDMARKLDKEYAVCSGVVLGSIERMYEVVSLITSETKDKYEKCIFETALDQGIFNKIVYEERFPIKKVKNGNNLIVTAGTYNSKDKEGKLEYELDKEKGIINKKGEKISIVHQYDRKSRYKSWIEKRYA